ncbi:MAG: hypothetical protein J1E98_11705 [Lachnospiraceae bacterium]|nr:hypothetical protein [Lachnospiraceae bacterium]
MFRFNILLQDVDVPEVVQKKADIAFSTIRTEENNTMKKVHYKAYAAAAACAALVIFTGISTGFWNRLDSNSQEDENESISTIENMFTLKVMAAELEEGEPVVLNVGGNDNSSVLGATDNGEISYCINAPFTCEGENIETVTYSVNNGAFQIVQPTNESIIVDGQLYNYEMNTGQIGGYYSEENNGLPSRSYKTFFYKSFTLDYDTQSDDYTWINICNALPYDSETFNLIWGDESSAQDTSNGINNLLDNTVITCTVNYLDGTKQSADILVGSQIINDPELGETWCISYELKK